MAALTEDRTTPVRDGVMFALPMAAGVTIHAGALVVLNATGYAQPATTATGLVALGRAEEAMDNADGDDGDETVTVRRGVFRWENSADADVITAAEIGDTCYIVDDQTVAKTDGTGTRSIAGRVVDLDEDGVWVQTAAGIKGDTGATGAAGIGVPSGGTTGQVLAKASNADYDTVWITP